MPDQLSVPIVKSFPEISAPKNPFSDLSNIGLGSSMVFPTVPAKSFDWNKPENKEADLLGYFLSKGDSQKSAPLYEYSTQQEKRYDNPFLQYTPKTQGSYDTEDVYGKFQGAGEQLMNSVAKTLAIAGATFVSGFTTIPKQIDEIRKGNLFEDSAFTQTQEWLRGMEDVFPNYYTQVERDRSWIVNAFTPTGFTNFWGDTILKNTGFTLGALANAVVVDSALSLFSAGTASPLALIDAGRKLSQTITPLKSAYRALSKAAVLGKTDEVVSAAKASQSLLKSLEATNKAYGLKDASKLFLTTYASAQGEAMIEGYSTYIDTKTKLLEQAYSEGKEFTPELLKGIEETSEGAGKSTAILNMAILGASNLVQFPKLMGWTKSSEILNMAGESSKYLDTKIGEKGLVVANNWNKKKSVKSILGTIGKSMLTEGSEEGSQYFIGNSLHDYYIDKFNSKSKEGMLGYMLGAIPKTLSDENFWHEAIIGAISGGIMGSVIPGSEIRRSIKQNSQSSVSNTESFLTKTLDQFNNGVASMVEMDEQISLEGVNKIQAQYKSLNRSIQNAAKAGSLDNLKDSVEDLKSVELNQYNQMFGTNFKTEEEKLLSLEKINREIDLVERDMEEVVKTFKTNPFGSSKIKEIIKKKFKVEDTQVDGIQQKLFEDWKENQTYTLGRLRNTQIEVNRLSDDLRLGSNVQDLDDFEILKATITTIEDNDALQSYLSFKNRTLEALRVQEEYYKELGDLVRKKDISKQIDKIDKFYQSLKEDIELKDYESLKEKIIEEEFPFMKAVQVAEMIEELKKNEEIVNNSEKEIIDNDENPEKSANDLISVVEQLANEEEASNPKTIEVPEMGFWQYHSLRQINPKSKFTLNGISLTLKDNSKTLITTEEGISITPEGMVINGKVEPFGELVITENSSEIKKPTDSVNPEKEDVKESTEKPLENKDLQDKYSKSKELYEEFKNSELTTNPNNVGGRYMIKEAVFDKGFTYYVLNENGSFTKYDYKQNIVRKTTVRFTKSYEFYSLDGENSRKLPSGKIKGTDYEVRENTVFYKGTPIDNPDNLDQKDLIVKHIKNREKFDFLNSNIGNVVQLNGKSGRLSKINNFRYEVESSDTIQEFTFEEIETFSQLEQSEINEQDTIEEKTSKYDIKIYSEEKVSVNGINYIINTDSIGNVESLSPENKLEQKITNKDLIIAVEIERNKIEVINQNSQLQEQDEINSLLEKNGLSDLAKKLSFIYDTNMTPVIESALEKLYEEKVLDDKESLQLSLWLNDAFERLLTLVGNENSEQEKEFLANAWENLEIISSLLYRETVKDTTKKEKHEDLNKDKIKRTSKRSKEKSSKKGLKNKVSPEKGKTDFDKEISVVENLLSKTEEEVSLSDFTEVTPIKTDLETNQEKSIPEVSSKEKEKESPVENLLENAKKIMNSLKGLTGTLRIKQDSYPIAYYYSFEVKNGAVASGSLVKVYEGDNNTQETFKQFEDSEKELLKVLNDKSTYIKSKVSFEELLTSKDGSRFIIEQNIPDLLKGGMTIGEKVSVIEERRKEDLNFARYKTSNEEDRLREEERVLNKKEQINNFYDELIESLGYKKEELKQQTQEEKIQNFINTIPNESFRAVLLSSMEKGLIKINC